MLDNAGARSASSKSGAIVGSAVRYAVGEAALRASELLLIPVYTRLLTVSEYGLVELVRPIVAVWTVLCAAGLPDATVRQRFLYTSSEASRRFTGTVSLGAAGIAVGLTFVAVLLGRTAGHGFFAGVSFEPYIQLSLLVGAGFSLPLIFLAYLQSAGRSGTYALLQFVQGLLTVILVTFFVVVSLDRVVGQLVGRLGVAAIMTFASVLLLLRSARFVIDLAMLGKALLFGLPILFQSVLWLVLQYADRLILQNFVPLDEVGTYALGYNLALTVGIVVALYNRAWLPHLYSGIASGSISRSDLAGSTTRFSGIALTAGLTVATFAPEAIRILAPASYGRASEVLPILAFGNVFLGLYQASTNLIWSQQRTIYSVAITFAAALANIALNLVLVPRFGIVGAAYATAAALALYAALATAVSRRVYAVPYQPVRLVILVSLGAVLYSIATLPLGSALAGITWKVAVCVVYALAAWVVIHWARSTR